MQPETRRLHQRLLSQLDGARPHFALDRPQDGLPEDIRDRIRRGDDRHVSDDLRRWQRILHAHGWAAAMWPVEHGGTGWDKTRQYLFEIECAAADAPIEAVYALPDPRLTVRWVAGFDHICRFIAGATRSGASRARQSVDSRSSASANVEIADTKPEYT